MRLIWAMRMLTDDPTACSRYSQAGGIHRIVPRAVAHPADEAELLAGLAWARERGLAVTPRGAGSSMGGGAVGDGLVLDLTGFAPGPPGIEATRLRAQVSPSLPLGELEVAAAVHGLRFGPDPSSAAWATVGGVIGTNAAGPRSHALGAVDRWVESLRLVTDEGPLDLARGRDPDPRHPVIRRFHAVTAPILDRERASVEARWPATAKNTAGYGLTRYWRSGALLDLVIGAEGTLGVVTHATLRLEPVPRHAASLRVVLDDREAIAAGVAALREVGPVAIELLDGSLLRLIAREATAAGIPTSAAAVLLVDLEDDDEATLARRLAEATDALGSVALAVRAATDGVDREALWAIRHAASSRLAALEDGRRSLQVVEDGCVPLGALGSYLRGIQERCDREGIPVVMFGHAGDGHVHVNLLPDTGVQEWQDGVERIFTGVSALVRELGGTSAGEHGAGRLRAAGLELLLGPAAIACFRAVKDCFDPAGLFNPGVILPDGTPPLGRLKVGAAAAAIPAGVERELREIEAGRQWGVSRWRLPG